MIWPLSSLYFEKNNTPPPGELVDVGGHKLHLRCEGVAPPGSPTIIIETGIWDCSESWQLVQPGLAQLTRVCSYDRAGYGWSEPGPAPRTFDRMVKELKTALEKQQINPPYLFIGHSLGGPIARYYHSQYPNEVSGIVFVDALGETPPAFAYPLLFRIVAVAIYCLTPLGILRLIPLRGPEWLQKSIRACHTSKPSAYKTMLEEWNGYEQSFKLLREKKKSLENIPVTYIVRDPTMPGPELEPEERSPVVAKNSTHLVHIDRPDFIIEKVRSML